MRTFFALCFVGSSIALAAGFTLQTFTSPDGVFRFHYSPVLVHCTAVRTHAGYPGQWVPGASCSSQAGVCDDAGSAATTIACFAYPKDKFKDKPTFIAAAFFVGEVNEPEKACLEGSRDWHVEGVQNTKINGVTCKLFHTFDGWTSGGQEGYFYRVFHNAKCYELGTQFANTSPGAFDPDTKPLTRQDSDEVSGRLKQIVRSFRFLR